MQRRSQMMQNNFEQNSEFQSFVRKRSSLPKTRHTMITIPFNISISPRQMFHETEKTGPENKK